MFNTAIYGLGEFLHRTFYIGNSQVFYNARRTKDRAVVKKKETKYAAVCEIMFMSLETHSIPTLLPARTSPVPSLKGETDPPFSGPPLFLSLMRSLGSHAMCYS